MLPSARAAQRRRRRQQLEHCLLLLVVLLALLSSTTHYPVHAAKPFDRSTGTSLPGGRIFDDATPSPDGRRRSKHSSNAGSTSEPQEQGFIHTASASVLEGLPDVAIQAAFNPGSAAVAAGMSVGQTVANAVGKKAAEVSGLNEAVGRWGAATKERMRDSGIPGAKTLSNILPTNSKPRPTTAWQRIGHSAMIGAAQGSVIGLVTGGPANAALSTVSGAVGGAAVQGVQELLKKPKRTVHEGIEMSDATKWKKGKNTSTSSQVTQGKKGGGMGSLPSYFQDDANKQTQKVINSKGGVEACSLKRRDVGGGLDGGVFRRAPAAACKRPTGSAGGSKGAKSGGGGGGGTAKKAGAPAAPRSDVGGTKAVAGKQRDKGAVPAAVATGKGKTVPTKRKA
ncbi:hypothetical protein DFJ73DRAFT_944633 [Zopfochytrium polystomum]|nr:hypothetical protein DFJ73DRAFT_944633 [Zopfochytrium polystomum]